MPNLKGNNIFRKKIDIGKISYVDNLTVMSLNLGVF